MQKIVDILIGALAGFLLALGLSRAADRLAGRKAYRYLGSGGVGRSAEARLWDSGRDHIDRAIDIISGSGESGAGEKTLSR